MVKFVGFVQGDQYLMALSEDGRVWKWLPVDQLWKSNKGEEFVP